MSSRKVELSSTDYWFKTVGMLQQNWSVIEPDKENTACTVYFIDDRSGVFDQLEFDDAADAERLLRVNGFERFAENKEARNFIVPPAGPYLRSVHPSGPIYSSGKYWRSR